MARKLRLEYPGAISHVLKRGDHREPIFRDDLDRRSFLDTLAESCRKTAWQVYAGGDPDAGADRPPVADGCVDARVESAAQGERPTLVSLVRTDSFNLDDIPTVKQVNALLVNQKGKELRYSRRGTRYSGSVLEVHHTVMGHVIDDFLGTSKFAEGMPSLLRADKVTSRDDALAWVLTQREHVGNGFDIHRYVDAELAALGPRPYRNVGDVGDALARAYRRAANDSPPVPGANDVADAVRAWLDDVKLPPTP